MKYENSGCRQTRSPRPRALAAGVSSPVLIAALLSLGPIALWAVPTRADDSTATTATDERASTLQEIVGNDRPLAFYRGILGA